jgi:hypothetical protein
MEELRRNPERGFAKLDAMGAVREVGLSDRAGAIADAFADSKGRTLVVCATHDEIDRVTELSAIVRGRVDNLAKA